ncbi:MAG: hypothetical protein IJV41_12565 [Oscillospiraceae bacterium]|nr:hypothetical protein [Oscillospiraceae bacterium]
MKTDNKTLRFITRSAMGVALVIVAQLLGKAFPAGAVITGPFGVNQLVTGSLVNCVLFVFTAIGGLWCGVTVGIVSALLASVIGVGPAVLAVVPLVACGNALLCVVFSLVTEKLHASRPAGAVAAAVCKCAFLWLTVPQLLKLVGAPEKKAAALSVMFSWPQGCTALIGGALALLIIPRLKTMKEV